MLRSEFDNLPVLIVEQIIRGILGHGLASSWLKEIGTGAVHNHSLVPIMNQTWGRVVDSMANECAELEIAADDFPASGVSDRSVRNSLRVVIANGHHALLKMFRLDITFARGFYPPIIDYITKLLRGNVFPAASTLLVTIRDEWVAWERPQGGSRGNTTDRSDSQDQNILTHARRFSADLCMLLRSAFPRVRNLGVEAISTNKEFRLVVIPGIYNSLAGTLRQLSTGGEIQLRMVQALSPAPLQHIKISLLKVELGWAALIRRNAQTLERLFIHTTDSDISPHILGDGRKTTITYPVLRWLAIDCRKVPPTSEFAADIPGFPIRQFPRLEYVRFNGWAPPNIVKAALSATSTIEQVSLGNISPPCKALMMLTSASQHTFPALRTVSIIGSLRRSYGTPSQGDSHDIQKITLVLGIGSQLQRLTYTGMHDISPGTFSTLSLDQPCLGILDISGTQIGIIDLLYLTNQLPALFRVKFSYAIERNPDWTISQFTSAQIASVRSKLPVVAMCSLREISLSAIRGNSHDYPTVLNAFYLIFLATTRLPSLATISSRDHYIATFSTLQQDISAFTRRSVFDDCPYIRDIEYREI